MSLLHEYIKESLKEENEKKGLVGNCKNSFDDETGEIINGLNIAYNSVTDFAAGDERAVEISEKDFRSAVEIPDYLDHEVDGHEVLYLLDEDQRQYMLYDSNTDTHWFFG